MKNPIATLRSRITAGVIAATLLVSIFVAAIISRNQRQIEESILYYALSEADYTPDASDPDSILMRRYSKKDNTQWGKDAPVPLEFRQLTPGLHRRIELNHSLYNVYVNKDSDSLNYLWMDITALDEREQQIKFEFFISLFSLILITAVMGMRIAGKLTTSIDDLIDSIRKISPEQRGVRIDANYPEAEIETIRKTINTFLSRLDGFVDREKEFIHVTSHELRTPIAVIQGAAEVLKSYEDIPTKAKPAIARIYQSSQEMNDIVSSLLFLAKEPIESPKDETTDIKPVITQLIEDLNYLISRKQIATSVEIDAQFYVNAPITIVRMVIGNIIRNAYQHTSSGTVFVKLSNGKLTVQDSGLGIPEGVLKQITERQNLGERRGFGISLTYRLCERFGWKVEINNTPGLGALVCVDFNNVS